MRREKSKGDCGRRREIYCVRESPDDRVIRETDVFGQNGFF